MNFVTTSSTVEAISGRVLLDPKERRPFVVNRGSNTLVAIEKLAARKGAMINVESRPFDPISAE